MYKEFSPEGGGVKILNWLSIEELIFVLSERVLFPPERVAVGMILKTFVNCKGPRRDLNGRYYPQFPPPLTLSVRPWPDQLRVESTVSERGVISTFLFPKFHVGKSSI